MSGKSETRLRDMCTYYSSSAVYITELISDIRAMNGMIRHLLYLSPKRQILYVTDVFERGPGEEPRPSRIFEHLSCFLPGLLALGVHELGSELPEAERVIHMWVAEGLAYSCWLMYAEGPYGLAPEEVMFEQLDHGRLRFDGVWTPKTEGEGQESRKDEKWYEAFEKWQVAGSRNKPPGIPIDDTWNVAQPLPNAASDRKDYFNLKEKYLLRPEVRHSVLLSSSLPHPSHL